ncbi:MAG: hypothetical protein ACJ77K_07930 [Bacteroidia bacterium]
MTRSLLFLALSLSLFSCKKDPPIPDIRPSEFQQHYGGAADDFGRDGLEYSNGDLYITGSTQSSGAGQKDIYVVKTDANGKVIWTRTFGGSLDDESNAIIKTADGNLLIVGTTSSFGSGGSDIYLVKLDTAGALLWQKFYGGPGNESGSAVIIAPDGNYLVNGLTSSFGAGLRDIYLLKLNTSGNLIWSKTYGGNLDDGGTSLCNGDTGDIMLFCFTDDFGAVNRDMYLLRLNSAGDSLASSLYGGTEYEQASSIERTTDGNFMICGHTASFGHPEHNFYALKIDASGAVIWQKDYGGTAHDGAECGEQSSDGGYVLAGRSSSFGDHFEQMYLVKTDGNGNKEWEKDIGGSDDDAAYGMFETAQAYFMVGNTKSVTNGNNDVFLVKILK